MAHSYGALVLLYALASGGIQRENLLKIQRVVVLAPPYFGTTFALLGLARSGDCMRKAGDFLPSLMKTLSPLRPTHRLPDELHCSGVRDIPESL